MRTQKHVLSQAHLSGKSLILPQGGEAKSLLVMEVPLYGKKKPVPLTFRKAIDFDAYYITGHFTKIFKILLILFNFYF